MSLAEPTRSTRDTGKALPAQDSVNRKDQVCGMLIQTGPSRLPSRRKDLKVPARERIAFYLLF